jgi:hypothetical protein
MRWKSVVLFFVAGTLCLFAGIVIAQERSAPIVFAPSSPTFSFGMIGLGTGASARLNVVNLVRTPPPILIPQVPCKVELDLYDGQGKLIKNKTVASLGSGQADFLDLAGSEVAISGTHVEISAVVIVGSGQSFFCSVSPTLEVFDSVTGTTTAILTSANTALPLIFTASPSAADPRQP